MSAASVSCNNCSDGILAMLDIYSGSTKSLNTCQYKTIYVFDSRHLNFWKLCSKGLCNDEKFWLSAH